ncbi:MAG TPA: selenocysteine-specific translation elongation factor [Bacillota bacterium]|nr:selenocysteine-specific translation elongation factor [Bacillota bacterium]
MKRYFSIGMAGHIDHGKTTLTKALTGVDTDRLKEEKERGLSIEPGFASLIKNEQMEVSLIDVPGHERFIRQMIAGVAGIDFVILVIAADEGVMPQTVEHLHILSLLGIEAGFVVITKIDQVDDELLILVTEDIKGHLQGTFLENAPFYFVDSVSKQGIDSLKNDLLEKLLHLDKRRTTAPFRLPIDHVFTVKGQGVVVRGTVYDGFVHQGDELMLLPQKKRVRVRHMQSHRDTYEKIAAGQRAALNISGVSYEEITRGDVLVADDFYSTTERIDIAFTPLKTMKFPLQQRQPVKLFVGTSEVMGRIIYFDRNVINVGETEEIVCQIELAKEIVVTRGDRIIIRRPTPAETIGGGWVIEPLAKKYRFGQATIDQLMLKKDGTAKERVIALLKERNMLLVDDIIREASISEDEFLTIEKDLLKIGQQYYTLHQVFITLKNELERILNDFHEKYPLRVGIDKAELISQLTTIYPKQFIELTIERLLTEKELRSDGPFLCLSTFEPHLPKQWETRLRAVETDLMNAAVDVPKWSELNAKHRVSEHIQREFYHYLIETEQAYLFDDERLISKQATEQAMQTLLKATNRQQFTLQQAREALNLSRKNLVPLLELFDHLGYTKRRENVRSWLN